ncbi:hypothetical protein C7S18_15590 [Ahniella affigens]|uniref:DUF1794 domain-containing protein n=2 Tax=Ahniella affigens TaxID=2021234 RepID=A0A2P1PUM2_9GAMM|nr:hypothetical protein C7S18_15590 [Ahniella affigens]
MLKRIAPGSAAVSNDLGLLSEFAGTWVGTGFNLIARPDKQNGHIFFLMLNGMIETLEFTPIGGAVPNRGSLQDDIFIHGLSYLQRVSDLDTHAALHIEPGFWLRIPKTTAPPQDETYARLSTIPHGDSLFAQSVRCADHPGGPTLLPVDSIPFTITGDPLPKLNQVPNPPLKAPLGYKGPYERPTLPKGVITSADPADVVRNPVILLQEAIANQTITRTVVIEVTTASPGGIVNIPFVVKNADTIQMDAIFWIETVALPDGTSFQQLQYVQRVMLDFDGIHWPHISVATLVKQ